MKISVIIPAYNAAGTICRAVDSVLNQRGAELQVIVVDDGSKDNLPIVLEKYGDAIKLISIENGGVANARNVGLSNADGDFVMFLDADDEYAEGCIEHVVKKQHETNADIVRFGYVIDYGGGRRQKPLHSFEKEELIEKSTFAEKIYPLYINGIMLNSICMTLFKKEIINGLRFRVGMKTAEDAIFSMQAYTNAASVLILPEEYYIYNQTGGSLTGNGLSVLAKYKCNAVFSGEIVKILPVWGMSSFKWYAKAVLRPLFVTFDKIRRMSLDNRS